MESKLWENSQHVATIIDKAVDPELMEYESDGFAECKDHAMISAAIMANERSYTRLFDFVVDVLNGKSEEVDNIVMQEQTIHSNKQNLPSLTS
jgi:hypothetical protein